MNKEKKGAKHTARRVKKAKGEKKNFFGRLLAGFRALPKGKKALIITLVSIILVMAIMIGVVLGVIGNLTQDYNHQEIDDPEIDKIQPIDDKIMNIALFGIDSRDKDFTGLSDSIMVLSINKETGDIKLISIMRDSFVPMPDNKGKTYKPNKINSAYSRGGAAYAIKTLNQNFGLDIKEYATVNFYGMAEIIDAVGGLEIDVLKREINSAKGLNDCLTEQAMYLGLEKIPYVTKPGLQVLSGIQAVAWARIRSVSTEQGTSNDYGRTDRQRVVMEKLLNKALSMDVSKYPALIKAMLPHMQTSLGFGEVLSLATDVLGKNVNFQQTRVPQQEYVINENNYISYAGSVVYYDLAFASKIIHAIIYDGISQEDYIAQNGIEKNKWYTGNWGSGSSKPDSSSSTNSSSENSSSVVSSTQSGTSSEDVAENGGSQTGFEPTSSQDGTADNASSQVDNTDNEKPTEPDNNTDNENAGLETDTDIGSAE